MAEPYFRINVPSESWFKLKVTGTGNYRAEAHFQRPDHPDDFWNSEDLKQGKRRKLKSGNSGGHVKIKFPGQGTATIQISIKQPNGSLTEGDPYSQQVTSEGPSPNFTSIAIAVR